MSERLTPPEIAAIRERHVTTTKSQRFAGWSGDPELEGKDAAGPYGVVAFNAGLICEARPLTYAGAPLQVAGTWEKVEANLTFIAAAHQDIPRLLDALETAYRDLDRVVRGDSDEATGQ